MFDVGCEGMFIVLTVACGLGSAYLALNSSCFSRPASYHLNV